MKSNLILKIAILLFCLVTIISCKKPDPQPDPEPDQEIMVTAAISNVLEGTKTTWNNGDSFSMFSDQSTESTVMKTKTSGISVSFTGNSIKGEALYALYPVISGVAFDGTTLTFDVPSEQKYAGPATAPEVYPMVAQGNVADGLNFKSTMGVLGIRVVGSAIVSSLTIKATDADGNEALLAGKASVNMSYSGEPVLTLAAGGSTSIQMNEINAALDSLTPFCVVMPAGTYKTVTVNLVDSQGDFTEKTYDNVTLDTKTRTDLAINYVQVVDLSTNGYANCYVVPGAGKYRFKTMLHDQTLKEGDAADYLWTDVECTWSQPFAEFEDVKEVTGAVEPKNPKWIISDIVYDNNDNTISFSTSANAGNAVIALYKNNGGNREIVWSWHIWNTGMTLDAMGVNWQSEHLVAKTQTLKWLDRNLGAQNALNTDNVGAYGMYYQWGRKDPFIGSAKIGSKDVAATDDVEFGLSTMPYLANEAFGTGFTYVESIATMEETAKTPMVFTVSGGKWASDIPLNAWGDGKSPFTKWQDWATDVDESENYTDGVRKPALGKTNNDPCPVGYRVPTAEELWNSFAVWTADNSAGYNYTIHWSTNLTTARSSITQGRMLKSYVDPENIFLRMPCSGYREKGKILNAGKTVYYWTSTIEKYDSNEYAYRWLIGTNMRIEGAGSFGIARPVRCVAEY